MYRFPVNPKKFDFITHDLSPYHTAKMKNAVDIVIPLGSEVHAARDGVVKNASVNSDGNKIIDILHSDGSITDYRHLSKFLVRKGQRVREGQIIALSGASGKLAGGIPHVHFEVDMADTSGSYRSVPFRWERAPAVVGRQTTIGLNKSLYDSYTAKRRKLERKEYSS